MDKIPTSYWEGSEFSNLRFEDLYIQYGDYNYPFLEDYEMYSEDQLLHMFTYHKPIDNQPDQYERIRDAAFKFAKVIVDNTPSSADQTVAIRKLRECVHVANASIALGGKS